MASDKLDEELMICDSCGYNKFHVLLEPECHLECAECGYVVGFTDEENG